MLKKSVLLVALALLGCAKQEDAPKVGQVAYDPVPYKDVPGWAQDAHDQALYAFRRGCATFMALPVDKQKKHLQTPTQMQISPQKTINTADMQMVCQEAGRVGIDDARNFFETWFQPVQIRIGQTTTGRFTGYYEAELHGSLQRSPTYAYPLYGKPADMVQVRANTFGQGVPAKTLVGRVEKGRLYPYYTRREIDAQQEARLASGVMTPVFWVDSAADAYILHVQGSGVVKLPDGQLRRVGYAANNGHKFTGIGALIARDNILPPGQRSMPAIREWMRANPVAAQALIAENDRYIFFRDTGEDGPFGAQGAVLTPMRSLAVDRSYVPLGVPVFVSTKHPDGGAMNMLMVAQDVGAAIKGAIRGDIFWGTGEAAFQDAGRMHAPGQLYILVPKGRPSVVQAAPAAQ
jgi:membrane-bound lytic murein transglycosylase A